jgi:hypothetical protein
MANELTVKTKDMVALMTDHSLGDLIKPLSHEILLFGSYIAGTSHIDDQAVFDDLKTGDKLILKREPGNRFDENAILVMNGEGRKLGYVPEKDNYVFARLMDAGKMLIGRVTDIKAKTGYTQVSMAIYLIDF